jgi:hypothetical protein
VKRAGLAGLDSLSHAGTNRIRSQGLFSVRRFGGHP